MSAQPVKVASPPREIDMHSKKLEFPYKRVYRE